MEGMVVWALVFKVGSAHPALILNDLYRAL